MRGYLSQVQPGGTPCLRGTPPWHPGILGTSSGIPRQTLVGGWYPLPGDAPPWVHPLDLDGRYPCWGVPPPWLPPHQTWPGDTLWGVSHLRYPPLDLGEGVPPTRGVPHLGYPLPPSDLAGGTLPGVGTPPQVIDGVLDIPRSVCLLCSRRRTFLLFLFSLLFQMFGLHKVGTDGGNIQQTEDLDTYLASLFQGFSFGPVQGSKRRRLRSAQ